MDDILKYILIISKNNSNFKYLKWDQYISIFSDKFIVDDIEINGEFISDTEYSSCEKDIFDFFTCFKDRLINTFGNQATIFIHNDGKIKVEENEKV